MKKTRLVINCSTQQQTIEEYEADDLPMEKPKSPLADALIKKGVLTTEEVKGI